MKTLDIESWHEFSDTLRKLDAKREEIRSEADLDVSSFLFRGQANAKWPLANTLERAIGEGRTISVLQYYGTILSVKPEIELFAGQTLDDIPSYKDYQETLQSETGFPFFGLPAYEYMVHLRHHGFPSPCYGSRYFGGSVPHTGRGNRGTSRQPDSAHGQRILALRMCQGASFAGSRLLLDTFYAPVKSDHERHPAPMPDHGTMSLEFRRT